MSENIKRKDRPGDQPLPVPNDGPSMHDLVCADLEALWPPQMSDRVVVDMQVRKQLGLARYGCLLQARNGRDALRDLYEELQDAAVYARQVQEESDDDVAALVYPLLALLIQVRRLRDEHS